MNDAEPPKLTPGQIRAARALLGITGRDLAAASKVGIATIRRAEGPFAKVTGLNRLTDAAIRRALEDMGIDFIDPSDTLKGGVALRRKAARG